MPPTVALVLLLAVSPAILTVEKRIGPGWAIDRSGWMSFVEFNADGSMVASDAAAAPDDLSGGLTLWSFPEGHLIRRFTDAPLALSPDFRYFAHHGGVTRIETGEKVLAVDSDVFAFTPDSRRVIAAHHRRIHVFDLADGKEVRAFGRFTPRALAVSPDGALLASGHWNGVALWDLSTGQRIGALTGSGRYMLGLSFSRDGKLLAAGTDAGGIEIWDVARRVRLAAIQLEAGETSTPAFSPNADYVAVGIYGTGTVWLIDVARGRIADQKKVSDLGCGSAAFSPDGRFLITPSTGGLVQWPYDRGGSIRVFRVNR